LRLDMNKDQRIALATKRSCRRSMRYEGRTRREGRGWSVGGLEGWLTAFNLESLGLARSTCAVAFPLPRLAHDFAPPSLIGAGGAMR